MRSSKTARKTSSSALAVWHVAPSCWYQILRIYFSSICVNKNSFNMPTMPLNQNPHQTVIRFGCVSFSMIACGFSVSQMLHFCLFTYPPKAKLTSSENIIFFPKVGICCKSIAGPLSEAKMHWLHGQLTSTPELIELCITPYQDLNPKFVSIMSPKCLVVQNDDEFMLCLCLPISMPIYFNFYTR